MESVGDRLKQARESRGLSLGDVAQATKIPVTALTALERNDLARIPGGIFGRSFVRGYAQQVGLDPDTIVQDFADEVKQFERERAREKTRIPITPDDREFAERQRRAVTWLRRSLVALVLVVLVALGWWLWAWQSAAGHDAPSPPPGESTGSQVHRSDAAAASALVRARTPAPSRLRRRRPLRPHL